MSDNEVKETQVAEETQNTAHPRTTTMMSASPVVDSVAKADVASVATVVRRTTATRCSIAW